MNQIILNTYRTRIEAEIAQGVLTANHIQSVIFADDEGGVSPFLLMATGYVKLVVNTKEYQKARELLRIK